MTDSGEVVAAEMGNYARVTTAMGPPTTFNAQGVPSAEFVRDHWEEIMAVKADGSRVQMKGGWTEMAGALRRHKGGSLRERRGAKKAAATAKL